MMTRTIGVAVVDMMTGMYAAQAILAALFERQAALRVLPLQSASDAARLVVAEERAHRQDMKIFVTHGVAGLCRNNELTNKLALPDQRGKDC